MKCLQLLRMVASRRTAKGSIMDGSLRNADSSQKDPRPAGKSNGSQQIAPMKGSKSRKDPSLHQECEKGEVKRSGSTTHLSPLLDPISPFSSLPENATPRSEKAIKHVDSDPITVTPPSQRNRTNNGTPPGILITAPNTKVPEEKQASETAVHTEDPPPAKPKSGRMRQSCLSSMCKDKDEPHIHAVLRRSSTLPTNDSTQICIDITGDREGIEQNGIPHSNEDGSEAETASQTQFMSIAPFLNACERWFPAFDPTLQKLLAEKAQQTANSCQHLSSMNAALFLLSRGPWIPTHISVHVRQAALAAVGVGWSWVNQVPISRFPLVGMMLAFRWPRLITFLQTMSRKWRQCLHCMPHCVEILVK